MAFSKMFTLFVAALLIVSVSAHMHLIRPKPIDLDNDSLYDWWIQAGEGPCRGKLKMLDSAPVAATWAAGTTQSFSLGGSSPHYGGSCQVSLSYDRGATWRVIKSFPGSCPHRVNSSGQDFTFKIPKEAPSGDAIFSWSWFNREQEMYHNCARVQITGGGSGIDHLPHMLVANVGNGCSTPRTTAEVKFPNPGPEVELGDGEYPLQLPTGDCTKGFMKAM